MARTKKAQAADTQHNQAIRDARRKAREENAQLSSDAQLPEHWFEEPPELIALPFRHKLTFNDEKAIAMEARHAAVAAERQKVQSEKVNSEQTASKPAEDQPSETHPLAPDWIPIVKEDEDYLIEHHPDLANYKMVFNQQENTRAILLRFPNRRPDQPYCARFGQKPLELRIKPKCGAVEVDIPIDIHHNWDLDKAIDYQQAMRKSTVLQHGGSYGLAGGLGAAGKSASADKPGDDPKIAGPSKETLLANIDDANNKGHVMNKITLAGQIFPPDPDAPRYLFGTFKNDVCYMSYVDAIVEVSANFQHLDALHDLNKSAARHQRNAEKEDEEPEAKAVNLTVKSADPDEDEMPSGQSKIGQLLKEMAEEPWQRLYWHDQDSLESYQRFDEHFGIDKPVDDLPELISTVTAEQWLDMISAPRYDYTTKSYREMTFPKKGVKDPKMVKDPRLGPYFETSQGRTTGYFDEDGWEYVDPSEPQREGFVYKTIWVYSDDEDDEDEDDDEYDEDDEDGDGDGEIEEEEADQEQDAGVHSGDEH
ncbi:MAG: hypothetical protein Q9201_003798 [Fulgogasparrea decipioides]